MFKKYMKIAVNYLPKSNHNLHVFLQMSTASKKHEKVVAEEYVCLKNNFKAIEKNSISIKPFS